MKKSADKFKKNVSKRILRDQENFRNSLMKSTETKTEEGNKSIGFLKARKRKNKKKKKMKLTSNP